jgi:hypothetical protein
MGRAKPSMIPAEKLRLYEALLATHPEVERKGAVHPYTARNGHMFSYLSQSGALALRLPAAEREKFLKKYKTALFEAYGAVMKEFVAVPETLLRKTRELQPYLNLSYDYVGGLKPKPTKKPARKKS